MFFLIPMKSITWTKPDIWAGVGVCPSCGGARHFHYCRNRVSVRLLHVLPVFSVTARHARLCDSCGCGEKLRYGEYHRACRAQLRELREGRFPDAVVRFDGAPERVRFGSQCAFLVLAILWGLLSLLGGPAGIPLAAIPLYRTITDFVFANAKRRAFAAGAPEEETSRCA